MPTTRPYEYDDAYGTCVETYSTLRIFSNEVPPDEITKHLGIEPTDAFCKGEIHGRKKLQRKMNGWFYTTKGFSDSKDTRRHIDMILSALDGKADQIHALQAKGCETDITSFWDSVGQGGPWLMPTQMLELGGLGISVWWDVYFFTDEEEETPSPPAAPP